jgi:hypothetical protein
MGRQILFHMLPRDCEEFLAVLQQRDPIVITSFSSETSEIEDLSQSACSSRETLCLWNQPLLPRLERTRIERANGKSYFRISESLPVLEMSTSHQCEWDGKPALTQGRVWGSFQDRTPGFESWYEAIARWIRKNYIRNPINGLDGYVSPAVVEWHRCDGILLPMLVPPVTPEWRKLAAAQRFAIPPGSTG